MKPLLLLLPALVALAGCDGGRAPVTGANVEWIVPIYQLDPQAPEDRPLVVRQPYELETPRGWASELEHEHSTRLYGPGVSRKRQILI